jgi:hypothetical protein
MFLVGLRSGNFATCDIQAAKSVLFQALGELTVAPPDGLYLCQS